MSSTEIEKENLEAHVELCAERYKQLENKISDLGKRMDVVERYLVDIKDSVSNKASTVDSKLIAIGTTVIGVMFAAIITLLVHLAQK